MRAVILGFAIVGSVLLLLTGILGSVNSTPGATVAVTTATVAPPTSAPSPTVTPAATATPPVLLVRACHDAVRQQISSLGAIYFAPDADDARQLLSGGGNLFDLV